MTFSHLQDLDRIAYGNESYAITVRGYTNGIEWIGHVEPINPSVSRLIFRTESANWVHELVFSTSKGYENDLWKWMRAHE